MKIPQRYRSKNLKSAFLKGYNNENAENPYLCEKLTKSGRKTFSKAFINAFNAGQMYGKFYKKKEQKLF